MGGHSRGRCTREISAEVICRLRMQTANLGSASARLLRRRCYSGRGLSGRSLGGWAGWQAGSNIHALACAPPVGLYFALRANTGSVKAGFLGFTRFNR